MASVVVKTWRGKDAFITKKRRKSTGVRVPVNCPYRPQSVNASNNASGRQLFRNSPIVRIEEIFLA
jgi:hypothetical protein